MTDRLDDTHDPALESWVESANHPDTDFPIQNLPFGRFREGSDGDARIGVAIGDQVLDLERAELYSGTMQQLMRLPIDERHQLRHQLSTALRRGARNKVKLRAALLSQNKLRMSLPCQIGDYTDFYAGIHHATAVGAIFRPEEPLLPNYKWLPVAYHGRSSSIGVGGPGKGHTFRRPMGQVRGYGETAPALLPTNRLDFELELGAYVGRPNPGGEPVTVAAAEEHLFGLGLLNDWSARDLQAWEAQPLGPFLSKNFATTVSPWIVTLEALAPFRRPYGRPAGDPPLLDYLDGPDNRAHGAFDITLEVWLESAQMRKSEQPGVRMVQSNAAHAYWTFAQLVAHHTVNGCNLRTGDLLGSGTLSGPLPQEAGSMLELSQGGMLPVSLGNGEERLFVRGGDTVILRGYCQRDGVRRIGFGECRGTPMPPRRTAASTETEADADSE